MKKILLLTFLLFSLSKLNAQSTLWDYDSTVMVIQNNDTLNNPWAGGLNFPLMYNTDLNGDGLKDLVVYDRDNFRLTTYLNTGTIGVKAYKYAPEFQEKFPYIYRWMIMADYDGDGLEDIFSLSLSCSCGIMVYHNDYTSGGGLQFSLVSTLLRESYGAATSSIYSSALILPTIADVDNDGDLDIVGYPSNANGLYEYHKNMSQELYGNSDSLKYDFRTSCWGGFQMCFGSNKVCNFHIATTGFPCGTYQTPPEHNDEISIERRRQWEMEYYSAEDAARADDTISNIGLIDMDGDGDKDVLVGDIGTTNLCYINNGGTDQLADMDWQDTSWISTGTSVNIQQFVFTSRIDADNDGTLDFIAAAGERANYQNNIWLYKNLSSSNVPNFQFETGSYLIDQMIDVGEGAAPAFVDYDNDGLLDLVVGNYGYGTLQGANWIYSAKLALYKNIGTTAQPIYEFITDDFANLSSFNGTFQGVYHPTFGDMDDDGDQDMLVGGNDGRLFYFSNTGGNFSFVSTYFGIDVGTSSTPQIADLNRDGLLDIICGSASATIKYFENAGTSSSAFFSSTPTNDTLGCIDMHSNIFTNYGFMNLCLFEENGQYNLMATNLDGKVYIYNNIDGNVNGCYNLYDSLIRTESEGFRFGQPPLSVAVADVTGDGRADVILGTHSGGLKFYRHIDPNGINDQVQTEIKSSMELFPNPASTNVVIKFYHLNNHGNVLSIYTPTGALLLQKQISQTEQQLKLDQMAKGIYMVTLQTDNNLITKKLLVK